MKAWIHTALAGAMALGAAGAWGQFVKGNEAVKLAPDGSRRVVTPPLPAAGPLRSTKTCAAADNCHAGAWLMVETREGLAECTDAYARPGTCRKSSYGDQKLLRVWVVQTGGKWLQCQRPDTSSKCVDMFARPPANLPFPAVQ